VRRQLSTQVMFEAVIGSVSLQAGSTASPVIEEAERSARGVLDELEQRLATHDVDQIVAFFTDDVVLIGDTEENFDRATTVAYPQLMAT
jgi:hypothetical protein